MKSFAAIGVALALCATAAGADSGTAALGEFGLLDAIWAPDCGKEPSPSNWYGRYRTLPANGASLTFSSRVGGEGELAYVILDARRVSPREILIVMEFMQEKRQLEIVLEVEADRYRTVSAKRPDGAYQIKDGKLIDDGSDSPWYHRCR